MSSGCGRGFFGRCEQRLTSGLPKPITAPCGSLTQLAARSGTSAGTQLRFFQMHPLAQPRGNLGLPDDPSAQRRRGIAPKNIATFNTHSEALEPMAAALWTSYDASFPAIWVEAMKKPSRAGGKPAKARSSKASKLERNIVPKAAEHRSSATQQIASWLEKLGMADTPSVLPRMTLLSPVLRDLTDQDLKDIGVASRASAKDAGGHQRTCWRDHQCRNPAALSRNRKIPRSAAKSR